MATIPGIESKVTGFLRTDLSIEAQTSTIDVDFVDEDDNNTSVTLQSDTLEFTIDPLNETGIGSERIYAASVAAHPSVSGRTRLSTVERGLLRYGTGQTGGTTNAKSWPQGTKVAVSTDSLMRAVNIIKGYINGDIQVPDTIVFGDIEVNSDINFEDTNATIRRDGNDIKFKDPNTSETTLAALAAAAGTDEKTKVSNADTTNGFLEDKFGSGDGLTESITNPGGNEVLTVAVDTSDTTTFVKTSSGSGDEDKVPVLDSTGKLASGFIPDPHQLISLTYGEIITAGDSLSLVNPAVAYGSSVSVSKDSYTDGSNPTTNYGSDTTLSCGTSASGRRIFIAFTFPSEVLEIVSFDLNIYCLTDNMTDIDVFPITSSWDEGTITWNVSPSVSATQVGGFNPVTGWNTVAITATAATSSDIETYGLQLRDGSGLAAVFDSSEGTNVPYIDNLVYVGIDGKIYKSDASYADSANNFIGFAAESGVADDSKKVQVGGALTTTGLTAGSTYYVSDTAGAIAASAGTNSKKVGLALSTTQLLIKNDN